MDTNNTQFKKKLEDEREIIIKNLQEISVNTEAKDKDDWEATPLTEIESADTNNVGDRLSTYENNEALVTDLETQLREIDLALNKIKDDSFGTCEVCSKEIEADRLGANPAARTCKTHLNEHLSMPQF